MVVICTRNTPDSTWVNNEIEYFQSLGRAGRVLPFLVEGEPEESYPRAIATAEPLAADVRPRKDLSKREVRHRALLKVVAGALEVNYDDLYQRDRRRRRNRVIGAAWVAAVALAVSLSWQAWTRTDAYASEASARDRARVVAVGPG